eukprot:5395336-Prymnesium_polylepis.1
MIPGKRAPLAAGGCPKPARAPHACAHAWRVRKPSTRVRAARARTRRAPPPPADAAAQVVAVGMLGGPVWLPGCLAPPRPQERPSSAHMRAARARAPHAPPAAPRPAS